MGLKTYFTGKTGAAFWLNIALMAAVLVAVPFGTFYALGIYTHHGEKIEVPEITGQRPEAAIELLKERGLTGIVSDSTYSGSAAPGVVLEQTPKSGCEVKSGRVVYLTINLNGEPMVKMPDLANNSSLREAEAQLKALGFRLTPTMWIDGEPKDFVIGIKQGMREVYAGEMVSRDRALTIVAGAGETEDTLAVDTSFIDDTDIDFDIDL
ncbi:MAG: PASTA domain-containing protein [Bacteroides sp.]|nr:PASTA domain-containing protein [Roseburia sp.]MCM1347216.1 PASTA domain-containing protein [Bacteroides sp.]MCM1420567.1 PASTA domain-containing protein [Bacteroides sp.]